MISRLPERRPPGRGGSPADRGPLVVVAGLPGAGKSTALRQFVEARRAGCVLVLDSDTVRRRLLSWLPGVPYRVLRPVVHTVHWARIAALALAAERPLLIHDTATRPASRAALLGLARLGRRKARLVWIEVEPVAALEGQRTRARVVRARSMRRHVGHVDRCHPAAAAARNWDSVCIAGRSTAAGAVRAAAVDGALLD